jgi:hypothetical protein
LLLNCAFVTGYEIILLEAINSDQAREKELRNSGRREPCWHILKLVDAFGALTVPVSVNDPATIKEVLRVGEH